MTAIRCEFCDVPVETGAKPYPAAKVQEAVRNGARLPAHMHLATAKFGPDPEQGWVRMVLTRAGDWMLCRLCVQLLQERSLLHSIANFVSPLAPKPDEATPMATTQQSTAPAPNAGTSESQAPMLKRKHKKKRHSAGGSDAEGLDKSLFPKLSGGKSASADVPAAGLQATPIDDAGWDGLFAVVTPELYRHNAFRILGVPVDATNRDLKRQADKLKMQEALGAMSTQRTGLLALDPPPDADAMREAMQRLHDPEQRLLEEFFWLWPEQSGQAGKDPALAAIERGDVQAAYTIWEKAAKRQDVDSIAIHNLAVLNHLIALDLEAASRGRPLTGAEEQEAEAAWQSALEYWAMVPQQEAFWSRLTTRIRELDDPRLTTGTARRLQTALPLALLALVGDLAIRACERGDRGKADRYARMLQSADFEPRVITQAARRAVAPVCQRLRTLGETAQAEAKANSRQAGQTTRRLIEQAGPLLAILDVLMPRTPTRDAASDDVAQRALECEIAFVNATENWSEGVALLESIKPLATTESMRNRLEDNIKQASKLRDDANDWCGDGYYNLPAPVLAVLETAREHLKGRRWDAAIRPLTEMLAGTSSVEIDGNAARLVSKALAYALNSRAVAVLNESTSLANQTLPIVAEIQAQLRNNPLSFLESLGLSGSSYRSPYAARSPKCGARGCHIYGSYVEFTFPQFKVPIALCHNCAARVRSEQDARRNTMRTCVREVLDYLVFAQDLDPANRACKDNMDAVRKMAGDVGASIPDAKALRRAAGIKTLADHIIDLCDDDARVRESAARALERAGMGNGAWAKSPDAYRHVSPLISRLERGSGAARDKAAQMLGELGPSAKAAIPVLVNTALTTTDRSVEERCVAALAKVDPCCEATWIRLVERLNDKYPKVRAKAAELLGTLGAAAEPAVNALLQAVVDDDNAGASEAAKQAILHISPNRLSGVEEIRQQRVKDRQRARRRKLVLRGSMAAAAVLLLVIGWLSYSYIGYWRGSPAAAHRLHSYGLVGRSDTINTAVTAIASTDAARKRDGEAVLTALAPDWETSAEGKAAVPTLLANLPAEGTDVRRCVDELLPKLDPQWTETAAAKAQVSPMIEELPKAAPDRQDALAHGLKAIDPTWTNSESAQKVLQKMITGLNPKEKTTEARDRERVKIVQAIGLYGPAGKQAIPHLAEVRYESGGWRTASSELRAAATKALGKMGPEAIPHLLHRTSSNVGYFDDASVQALADMGPQAIPALIKELRKLGEIDEEFRQASALEALGRMGPTAAEAVPAIVHAREKFFLRRGTGKALARIAPQSMETIQVLISDLDDAGFNGVDDAMGGLVKAGEAAKPELLRIIKNEKKAFSLRQRQASAIVLARIDPADKVDEAVGPVLVGTVLYMSGPDDAMGRAAMQQLIQFGSQKKVVSLLIDALLLVDRVGHSPASDTLWAMGEPVMPALREAAASHHYDDVRRKAKSLHDEMARTYKK